MHRRKLLYITSNDGSDMRINKELKSLATKFEISYVGVGLNNTEAFAAEHCKFFYLVIGRRNHPYTIVRQFFLVARLIWKYDTVHIINEQLMIFFYPFLFKKFLVLDIFDSIFLTMNKSGERWKFIKKIVYAPVNKIIVTDENRKKLMPSFTWDKISVVENYPNKYTGPVKKNNSIYVTILYNGWLGVNRGTDVIEKLLSFNNNIKVIMAGWFADKRSKKLVEHPSVDYRGIMSQPEAMTIAATEADYILCVYAPINENNINASPNKIYDSIQTQTPVITNTEIKISSFVKEKNIGVVIDRYQISDPALLAKLLHEKKNSFTFSPGLISQYTWEQVESTLIDAHNESVTVH